MTLFKKQTLETWSIILKKIRKITSLLLIFVKVAQSKEGLAESLPAI
jgi:hypothetical protein